MLPKFLESLGDTLAKEWVAKVFTPAFVFWFGGALAWGWRFGWNSFDAILTQKTNALPIVQVLVGLLLVAVSAIVVQRLELNVLRFLEGYWVSWLRPLRKWLIHRQAVHGDKAEQRFQTLAGKGLASLTADELDEYARLDWQLKQTPVKPDRLMPTQLGNILRAAELRSLEKYGLESIICFPRLWLLLPNEVKTELTEARGRLNAMVRIWVWSVLFLGWGIWAWWAIPIGIIAAFVSHRWILDAAVIYGDLVESAFDLYRTSLYKSLRWKLPTNPTEERQTGAALTDYLWRGFTEPEPMFEELEKK
jgi:hypothetical protein